MNIAIVGVTGMVGTTFLKILDEFNYEPSNFYLYASKRSAGKVITYRGVEYKVIELCEENIVDKEIDYALFSAGGGISLDYAKVFTSIGATVIDNSSAWRMDDSVPLVVPEVNMDHIKDSKLIANPNCSTIECMLPLKALSDAFGITDVVYSTYQAVSGSGVAGVADLERTSNGEEPKNYPYPIYNNVLPHIDVFLENGYTKEEVKMVYETKKILGLPDLNVSATCVRVPVVNSHSVSVTLDLVNDATVEEIKTVFSSFENLVVEDEPTNLVYPMPINASGKNETFVGRIRKDLFIKNRVHFFVVSDNIRKGAALNAVQIMDKLVRGE